METLPSAQGAEPAVAVKILVAEDNADTREVLALLLQHAGYRVVQAADGAAALRLMAQEQPELLIVDLNMPELGGFEVVEAMRQRGFNQPVLILTGYSELDRRIKGLGLGADDCMTKPFDDRELRARVAALLRRVKRNAGGPRRLSFGEVTVDLEHKTTIRGEVPIALSPTEYAVLELLAREKGGFVTRERLLGVVWGYDRAPNTRTVETTIWRLRKKLEDPGNEGGRLLSHPGRGYRLAVAEAKKSVAPLPGAAG